MPRLGLRPRPPLGHPFEVNRRSQQYVGLAGWWSSIGGLGRVLVGSGPATVSGAPVLTSVADRGFGYSTATGDRVRFELVGTGTGPTNTSLCAWIKTASSSPAVDAYVVTAGQVGETQAPYHILPAYGGLYSGWQDGGGFHQPDAGAIAASTVMLLVVTYDGTNLRVYRDGILMLTSAQTSTATWTMTSMAIGNLVNNTTNSSGGHVVLDARLYRRVLSVSDIWQLWAPQTRWDLFRPAKWRTIVQAPAGGGDVTVSPGILTLTASILAPTVSATRNVTVSPSLLTATTSILAPSVSGSAIVSPAQLTATVSVLAPAVSTTQNPTISPAQLTATSSILAPTVSGQQQPTITPSLLTATASVLTATVSAVQNPTIAPAQLTATVSLLAPTVSAGGAVTVSPSQLSVTASVLAPTITAAQNVTVSSGLLTTTASLLAPTISTTQTATVTPALLTASTTVLAATVSTAGNGTVSPALLTATASVQAPTISAAQNATVSPSLLTLVADVLAASILTTRSVTATPAQIVATITLLTPTVSTAAPNAPGTVTAGSAAVGGVTTGSTAVGGVLAGVAPP